jgi:hypothetical protein
MMNGCRGLQVGHAACDSVIGPNERDPGPHIISHRPFLSHYGKLGKHNSTVPLPFVTALDVQVQDVGDATTGILQFPVFHALLVGERLLLEEIEDQSTLTDQLQRLAQVIQHMDNLPEPTANLVALRVMSAHNGIPVVLEPLETRIRKREHRLIHEIDKCQTAKFQARVTRMVTAAIRYRLGEVDLDCANWTDDETLKMTEGLRDAIYNFMLREQRGGKDQEAPDLQAMAENLGKPNLPQPTGAQSSGESTTYGPTINSSPVSDSPTAPKRSSGKRSKQAPDS